MSADNVAVVEAFWEALARRDFDAVGAMMSERGHYADVPVLDVDPGAFGPTETSARLALGLGPLAGYTLHPGTIVASGDVVVTEHVEDWRWESGETASLRFCSVMEVRGGLVDRWWDYWDLGALMNAAPAWWVEQIAVGYK
ncbi:MAG: SnoaL-like domain-containing protein [Actinobacteria bacterium]|nr:SnoaL-like domain-containing protein [Actinomycetota bacterium]